MLIAILTVVLISISWMSSDVEHLFMSVGHLYVFFGGISLHVRCLFFDQIHFTNAFCIHG